MSVKYLLPPGTMVFSFYYQQSQASTAGPYILTLSYSFLFIALIFRCLQSRKVSFHLQMLTHGHRLSFISLLLLSRLVPCLCFDRLPRQNYTPGQN